MLLSFAGRSCSKQLEFDFMCVIKCLMFFDKSNIADELSLVNIFLMFFDKYFS